jgi:hypothetical protein
VPETTRHSGDHILSDHTFESMSGCISESEYLEAFPLEKRARALDRAMDIRKFEIDLYWKRARYFWTFIGASLAGYAAVQVSAAIPNKSDLSVLLSCLGTVFSFG